MFFIVSFLTILNFVYWTFILYRQLYFVNKGGKTGNFRFLNQINVLNVEMFCFALKIVSKYLQQWLLSVSFEHKRQIFAVILQTDKQCQRNLALIFFLA